jgi:hypothetical protein
LDKWREEVTNFHYFYSQVVLRETCDSEEKFRVENEAAGGGAASTVYCGTSGFG